MKAFPGFSFLVLFQGFKKLIWHGLSVLLQVVNSIDAFVVYFCQMYLSHAFSSKKMQRRFFLPFSGSSLCFIITFKGCVRHLFSFKILQISCYNRLMKQADIGFQILQFYSGNPCSKMYIFL